MGINRSGANQGLTNTLAEQQEIVVATMVDWWYGDAGNLIPKMTNSAVKGQIEQPGAAIVFIQEPEAQVQPYLRDAPIAWSSLTPARTQITVDYSYISAHKLDVIDEYEIKVPILQKIGTGMGKKHAEQEIAVLLNVMPTFNFLSRLIIDNTALAIATFTTGVSSPLRGAYQPGTGGLYIIGQVSAIRTKFNRGRVPKQGRYLVVTPEVEELLINSDQATFQIGGVASKAIEDGEWGIRVCGFDILVSEFVPGDGSAGAPFKCLAGQKDCLGFGRRIQKVQLNVQLQDYMATGHRSLNYFGFGALNLKGLGLLKIRTS